MSNVGQVTPLQDLEKERVSRLRNLTVQPTDGPVLSVAKWFANCPVLHWPICFFVRMLLRFRSIGIQQMLESEARNHIRAAIEWYWILWTIILIFCYVGVVAGMWQVIPPNSPWLSWLVFGGASIIAVFQLCEFIALSLWLHFFEEYQTSAPAHALLLTFFAFFHAGIAFSLLYCTIQFFGLDFVNCKLTRSCIDPLYFSIVTMTTLGYGDISPQTSWGRALVMVQLFYGMLLLVVAFQRVLGSMQTSQTANPQTQPPTSAQPPTAIQETDK